LVLALLVGLSCFFLSGFDKAAAQGGGRIQGTVYVRNYMGDYRQLGSANITVTGGSISVPPQAVFTAGGFYHVDVPPGNYVITANVPGYKPQSFTISVSDGSSTTVDFRLEESGVPIPEFQEYSTLFITSISLLLVVILMRRRTVLSPRLR